METIYLVGQISPKYEETYKWREHVRNHFSKEQYSGMAGMTKIQIIDPCSNPFNAKVLKRGDYAVKKEKRSFGIDLLPPKDYTFCRRSTICMANMNQYDPDKPLIGSFFELAWYYTMPEKSVIAFADDLDAYTCQHPFVKQAVHTWCGDFLEACYLVDKYFINTNGA
jgi:hypothetical protein